MTRVQLDGWWRWALRTLGVLALVTGAVLLVANPTASRYATGGFGAKPPTVTFQCPSPFGQLTGTHESGAISGCSAATTGREHIVESLGSGAVVLVGLSFLRRRGTSLTSRLEPSTTC